MSRQVKIGVYLSLHDGLARAHAAADADAAATAEEAGAAIAEDGAAHDAAAAKGMQQVAAAGAAVGAEETAEKCAEARAEESDAESEAESEAGSEAEDCCAVEMCKMDFELLLLRPNSGREIERNHCQGFTKCEAGWGSEDFIFKGDISSWQQIEQKLQSRRAVGADGWLHIRAVVNVLE
jgi:hypothetical protein